MGKEKSSFWTTGIWVLLRYLAMPVMIGVAVYVFGGPTQRTKINGRAYAMVQPLHEAYLERTGQSELLQTRVHFRDPDLDGTAAVRLGDLPVAAKVPVVNLSDLPRLKGPSRTRLPDLPEPIEDTVVFLMTKPLAIATSPRPIRRPDPES
ncbi:hypothetical protein [Tropicimonas sp. IMCC6043]|uniref:hypothetical protein n=1 Tax=Tropicimonas sp. IMCC6043 TaxID=2510645 RepID=UPI00101DD3C7|nr:hypothetical protein [Tropicimonas sp. IMCC6043]RYH08553.1 hypothetical protein EU800_16045 [Tropicimonas sp. IMCC6043]